MGQGDKAEHSAQDLKGQAKEKIGEVTDNDRLQREGRSDQTSANLKQAGEKVKDAFTGGSGDRA